MAALDNVKLKDVLADVASGSLQLPDFQRNWKWDDDRIRAIIATVTLDYPLGVVMTLQTGGATRFRSRTLTGARPDGDPEADLLLLDGQQRLTSVSAVRDHRLTTGALGVPPGTSSGGTPSRVLSPLRGRTARAAKPRGAAGCGRPAGSPGPARRRS
ncbi:DUF262 domain-containing protein [Streptomyces sp. KMM 9044]|nr:DUF262 domain-containing protein [Streptomyces sp. KMM 9044]WAX76827.1 DUF262 domain-containing protein [Streptomyces sp. KMM 9044]